MRFVMSLALLLPVAAWAGANDLSLQGRLVDATGEPHAGSHELEIALYPSLSGGEATLSRSFPSVEFIDGYYQIDLLNVDPEQMTTDPYVALSIDGELVGPRQPLNASGVARVALQTPLSRFAKTAERAAGGCTEVKATWPGAGSGVYFLRLSRSGEAVAAWCTMDDEGAWLDIVASFHQPDADESALSTLWFNGGTGTYAVAATNSDGTPGVLVRNSEGSSHQQNLRFQPEIASSAVRVTWRLQGSDEDYRCSHSNWIPLNGPGWNGGHGSYYASCPSGYSCVQGSPTNYRDAPVAASYSNNSFNTASQLLLWSGSNTGAISRNCARDPLIPSSEPALFITDLRVQQ